MGHSAMGATFIALGRSNAIPSSRLVTSSMTIGCLVLVKTRSIFLLFVLAFVLGFTTFKLLALWLLINSCSTRNCFICILVEGS